MTPPAEIERNKATLERLMEAMGSGDAGTISNAIDECYAPDAVIHTPVLDITGRGQVASLRTAIWTAGSLRAYLSAHR